MSEEREPKKYITITLSVYKKLMVVKHAIEEEKERVCSFSEVIDELCDQYLSGEGLLKR
jgi:predicted CopG family antitoxin